MGPSYEIFFTKMQINNLTWADGVHYTTTARLFRTIIGML